MTHRAVLAICLVCATAPLTTASTAQAEEIILTSPPKSAGARPYPLDPIFGLDPVKESAKLTMLASRLDPLRPSAPRKIVSSDEKILIIVAASIVGVVLVIAVVGRH